MGRKRIVRLQHRRRREQKTDYRKRLKLLKSKKARFVVRKTLNNITCQIIEHNPNGDITRISSYSGELKGFGWLANTGNIPSAYLTGLLCGLRAVKEKIEDCILDMGLYRSTRGSRVYAALKGALDAGLNIPHSDANLPEEKRIKGFHISEFAKGLTENDYKKIFSLYLKNKLKPEELPEHFERIKSKIIEMFK